LRTWQLSSGSSDLRSRPSWLVWLKSSKLHQECYADCQLIRNPPCSPFCPVANSYMPLLSVVPLG
jgi:hypothetical protein